MIHPLRKKRLERGLTQEELAKLVGCDPTYVTHLENWRGQCSMRMGKRFAKVLGVTAGIETLFPDPKPATREKQVSA